MRKIDLTDLCVVLALSGALFLTICQGQEELAMSIAGGMMGYIGGSSRGHEAEERAWNEQRREEGSEEMKEDM